MANPNVRQGARSGRVRRRLGAVLAAVALCGGTLTAYTAPAQAAPAGVPSGIQLTESRSITVTKPGTVIDAMHVRGTIAVKADNVTIRNTEVSFTGYHSIRIYDGFDGTRIENTTVNCDGPRTNGIVFGNYTADSVALNDCRNNFMSSDSNPATVTNSTIDGVPYSTNPTPEPTPEPEPTPDPEPTPEPEPTPDPEPTTPVADDEWPTPETTGPRYPSQTTTGSLSSSEAGQVIERTTVNGRLTVRHDNVTVRDVLVNGTGTYMIHVVAKADGTCPVNVKFEYVEIDGANAAENHIPLYAPKCGYTFDHGYIHNVGRSSRIVNDTTITNSYVYSSRTGDSGAHRGGIGINGGSNNALINNVVKCSGAGCSGALPMYGDFAPVENYLIQHNLLATTGSYCAYGGSLKSKPYPHGSNIRFIDNHFSTEFYDTCGRYGPIAGFDNNVRGNEFTGNVWHETGQPLNLR